MLYMYIFIYNLYFVYFVYVRIIYVYVILNTNSIQLFKKKFYEKFFSPGNGIETLDNFNETNEAFLKQSLYLLLFFPKKEILDKVKRFDNSLNNTVY